MTVERLAELFAKYGFQWRQTDGTLFVPAAADIKDTLDRMRATLYDRDDATQMMVGRILLMQIDDQFEVYLYLGDLDDNDSPVQ